MRQVSSRGDARPGRRRPRAVLFDLHGTLVYPSADNLADRRRAAYRVLAEWPGAPSLEAFEARDEETREKLRLSGAAELRDYGVTHRLTLVVRSLLGDTPSQDLIDRMVEAYVDAWIDILRPLPGTHEALDRLQERYRMALVTDFGHTPGIWRILDRFGLRGYFQPVVVSAEVGHTKPHPAMFGAALRGLGVAPDDAVFVGDNPVCDIEGAKRAGILPILIDVDGRHSSCGDHRIVDLRELPPLLEKLLC